REGGEACDGADLGGAVCPEETTGTVTCRDDCRLDLDDCNRCGDGHARHGEECDDGNNVSGDGCDATCHSECGDGKIGGEEECDDGNRAIGDGCLGGLCNLEGIYPGGGGEPGDACGLLWGYSHTTTGPLGATAHCQDDGSPCDRGPKGDGQCSFLVYFCM